MGSLNCLLIKKPQKIIAPYSMGSTKLQTSNFKAFSLGGIIYYELLHSKIHEKCLDSKLQHHGTYKISWKGSNTSHSNHGCFKKSQIFGEHGV